MADITVSKEEWDRVIEILDQANKTVESVKPQWISVTERLPDDYVPVLVYAKHIDGKRTVFLVDHIIGYTNGCKTWADIDKTWKYFVTHWMPLPEPPKEGGGEDGV